MVTRRYQREYQNQNLNKTIQWSQEDTKEIIRTLNLHKTIQWSQEDTKEIIRT